MSSKFWYKLGMSCTLVLSAFLFVLLFSRAVSPLYTFEGSDSSVFKLMGYAILKGKIPYVDIFDHKGPVIYLIEAFGQWLYPGRLGLFVLAGVSLSISVLCWYKGARLFTTPAKSLLTVLLTLWVYYFYTYSDGGNYTEDWNVLFISVANYTLLLLFFGKGKTGYALMAYGCLIGACLACSFLIRPNDAVALIAAPILGMSVLQIREKRLLPLSRWISGALLGFVFIIAIFVIWFAAHDALPDLWYGLIGFNSRYSTGITGLIMGCIKNQKLVYLPFLLALVVLIRNSKNSRFLYVIVPEIVAAYILLGTNDYLHYWIVWIPAFFFLFILFSVIQQSKVVMIMAVCVLMLSPIFHRRNWLKGPVTVVEEMRNDRHSGNEMAERTKVLFESLSEDDKDSIWCYNLSWHGLTADDDYAPNTFNVLLYNKIIPCNRVPLVSMAERDESLLNSMDITVFQPKLLLYSVNNMRPKSYYTRDSTYIQNNYHIRGICDSPSIILLERNE